MAIKQRVLIGFSCMALLAALATPASAQLVCNDPGNLTTNCGFGSDISGWTITGGTPTWVPDDGNDQLGCLEIASATIMTEEITFEQCLTTGVAGGVDYGFGVFIQVTSGPLSYCNLWARQYSGTDCSGYLAGTQLTSNSFPQTWNKIFGTFTSAAGTQSVLLRMYCGEATPFIARFDDFFLGENLTPVDLQTFTVQ